MFALEGMLYFSCSEIPWAQNYDECSNQVERLVELFTDFRKIVNYRSDRHLRLKQLQIKTRKNLRLQRD